MLVAIERTGPARDGTYRTMRGFDMTRFVAPLERLLHAREAPLRSIGIGDGGNELGMGKVRSACHLVGVHPQSRLRKPISVLILPRPGTG